MGVTITGNPLLVGPTSVLTFGAAPVLISVSYLVVGGGSSGGASFTNAGGGGAVLTGSNSFNLNYAYSLRVGDGGIVNSYGSGGIITSGTNSIFANVTANGGNGSTSGSGYAGGANYTDGFGQTYGGGGGGAAGVGQNAGQTQGGPPGSGGSGITSAITGTSIVYGQGGDGGNEQTGSPALSGGGNNTGGGGGGGISSANGNTPADGTNGGSGIVVLKIPNTNTATFNGTVSSTLSTAVSGYKIYTVTTTSGSPTVSFS
jgi:hypothetical protein